MPPLSPQDVEHLFVSHTMSEDQKVHSQRIRNAAKEFTKVLIANTPPSADQTAAVRKVREAVFTANAAIVLKGQF